jgi:hypothetical protein
VSLQLRPSFALLEKPGYLRKSELRAATLGVQDRDGYVRTLDARISQQYQLLVLVRKRGICLISVSHPFASPSGALFDEVVTLQSEI